MTDHLKTLTSFEDLCTITETLKEKPKGDLFELFTYYLFKLDPRLNAGLQNIWLYNNIPEDILTQLNLPTRDKGIDLLAQIDNLYYPIQCKFRQDPNQVITWTDLSTFFGMAFGMTNKMNKGFLVTNTYDLCQEVINSDKVTSIYGEFFNQIDPEFYHNLRNITTNQITTYTPKVPYFYQRKCDITCALHFLDNSRGYIEFACGSGKTLTSYWIDKNMLNNRTVVFVPSLYLLSQFFSDWIKQSYAEKHDTSITRSRLEQRDIKFLLIGSDADIDEETKWKSNGLILHTSSTLIRKFIRRNYLSKIVVICTYQSSDKLAKACKTDLKFDFAILDEAHKTVGQVSKKFSRVLDDSFMFIYKRLSMTATPKMYKGDVDTEEIVSMDNEAVYGKCIYTYNTGTAIKEKRLVDYQVISMYARDKDIERDIKKHKLVKFAEEFADLDANYLGTILLLLKKIHDGTCKHLVTYHNKVKAAKAFSKMLKQINELLYEGDIYVGHLNGSTSMSRRNKIIRGFVSADVGILCSARVLNEGVNIPIIDSVCFVDPRFSTIDIVQCIGRSLRLCEDKRMAYVIVPIFITDFESEFDKGIWGNVIRILKAMKSTDEGIVEYFGLKMTGWIGGREIVVNEFYGEEKFSEEIDLVEWSSEIWEKVWQVVDNWQYRYTQLRDWIVTNQRIPSEKSTDNIEKNLGALCSYIRNRKKNGNLSEVRIQQMNNIELWCWNELDKKWNRKYKQLYQWISKNDMIPKQSSTNIAEQLLARWCMMQRKTRRQKSLSLYRIKKLEKLKYWYWTADSFTKCSNKFETRYNNLKHWIKINHTIPRNTTNDPIEKSLGTWCTNLRKKWRNNKLSDEHIKLSKSDRYMVLGSII